MRCAKCGTELPDEAAFCWKCGQPQKPAESPAAAEPEYEYCDLTFIDRLYGRCYEARRGNTLLLQSPYSIISRREANEYVVGKLAAQGWEPIQRDERGYVIRMRRIKQD